MQDVLELLLARILEGDIELALHILSYPAGDTNTARLCKSFQTRRYIYTVTVDVATVNYYVAEIDPYAEIGSVARAAPPRSAWPSRIAPRLHNAMHPRRLRIRLASHRRWFLQSGRGAP